MSSNIHFISSLLLAGYARTGLKPTSPALIKEAVEAAFLVEGEIDRQLEVRAAARRAAEALPPPPPAPPASSKPTEPPPAEPKAADKAPPADTKAPEALPSAPEKPPKPAGNRSGPR